MAQPDPLPRPSDSELITARMKAFEEARGRRARQRHAGWCSLNEDELRYALMAAMREPTEHGYAHCDGSTCHEPVWCQREHVLTPKLPKDWTDHVHARPGCPA